jgi:hypothetical protein
VAQAVEGLLCKYEALSSKPSATKKKKKERKESSGHLSKLKTFSNLTLKFCN